MSYQSYESGSTSASALSEKNDANDHFDLIAFLSAVQASQVDILPIPWQPEAPLLGQGGSAIISQSQVSEDTNFAFKRTENVKPLVKRTAAESLMQNLSITDTNISQAEARYDSEMPRFQTLITELLVLRHTAVRDHPNIIDVNAICWGVDRTTHEVWPVLVFPKSELGDLQHFMNSEQGLQMNPMERIKLCLGILEAVSVLHKNGIIHGDIKPQNILLFEDKQNNVIAKLADFGWSSFTSPDNALQMPYSGAWTAPEHHGRGFIPQAAKRMDIYSLGMLCLWCLFKDGPSDASIFSDGQKSASSSFTEQSGLRELGAVAEMAREINAPMQWFNEVIGDSGDFYRDKKEKLSRFFKSTLAINPERRVLDIAILVALLEGREEPPYAGSEPLAANTELERLFHCEFKVTRDILDIARADYRVRISIFNSLKSQAQRGFCAQCSPRASFQVAICYGLGFGVARSAESAAIWVQKSGLGNADLEAEIDALQTETRVEIVNEKMWEHYDKGHFAGVDHPYNYRASGCLETAEKILRREVCDLEQVLRNDHIVIQTLEMELGDILSEKGDLQEAELIQRRVKQKMEDKYGLESNRTWNGYISLSSILGKQQKWSEVQLLMEKVVGIATGVLGPDHVDLAAMKSFLVSAYNEQGQWKKAEELGSQILKTTTRTLGDEHPFVQDIRESLASSYVKQARLTDAELMYELVIDSRKKSRGSQHSETLLTMGALAMIWSEQGRWNEANELEMKVLEGLKHSLGDDHIWTASSMDRLASTYRALGQYKEAKDLLVKAVEVSQQVSGLKNPATLKYMNNLCATMQLQGQWQDLEAMQLQIVEVSQEVLGADHPDLLACWNNLAMTFDKIGKQREAEVLQSQVLQKAKRMIGPEHPTTLLAMVSLAGRYRDQGRLDEAESLERQALEIYGRTLGAVHPDTLLCMGNLSVTLLNKKEYDKAEAILTVVLDVKKANFGPSHPSTLKAMCNLARVYAEQDRLEDAEELESLVCSESKATLGVEHPFTRIAMANRALTLANLGQLDKAVELQEEVLEIRVRILGSEHDESVTATGFLNAMKDLRIQQQEQSPSSAIT